jgi:hypothetical protein
VEQCQSSVTVGCQQCANPSHETVSSIGAAAAARASRTGVRCLAQRDVAGWRILRYKFEDRALFEFGLRWPMLPDFT